MASTAPTHCPVAVEDDDGVGGGEVQPEAAGARRQQEEEDVLVAVEELDLLAPIAQLHRAVEATRRVAAVVAVVLQDVEDLRHLAVQQHLCKCKVGIPVISVSL